ncbi:MAG: carbamoyl phosphate synthase small subunit, partial [Bdellovibrionaceae bacterium]|nr:carbamoyl phosphate synthase small subunit [Pseudobdellovibrionaceae bacterium]
QWACVFSETQYLKSKKSLEDFAKEQIVNNKTVNTVDYTKMTSCKEAYHFEHSCNKENGIAKAESTNTKRFNKVAVLDMGCKTNILHLLKNLFKEVVVYPYNYSAEKILKTKPDMIVLSNGPGDPEHQKESVAAVKDFLSSKVPIFGICMGCQILALALGAKTYKLKFGHRGSNHPIEDFLQKKIYMSSQNHGYAIEKNTLPKGVEISHINLNDKSVAGIFSKEKKFLAVQFHPEHSPGPEDAVKLLPWCVDKFLA